MQLPTLSCAIVIFVMNKCAPQFLGAFSKKEKYVGCWKQHGTFFSLPLNDLHLQQHEKKNHS
jgi:hypothetical protein